VVDLGAGQLLGFEALVRWHHPTDGVLLPSLLIPWAEANGDIVALGNWVLQESCREAIRWPSNVQLAVNCSIVQLKGGAGSAGVTAALEESGLMPDRLTVECTERALSDEAAIADLRLISALGVQLAMDDVGSSWNSFEALRPLTLNTVKIDNSFIMGLEAEEGINRTIVETVVQVAHRNGLSTVAEGVETEFHASVVRQFDSDAAQGYYFAPPLSQENATKMANIKDLRFPLEGPGWDDHDDWPFAGASEGSGRLVVATGAGRGPDAVMPTGARIELDDIDLVDLVLEAAAGSPPDDGPPGPAAGDVERAGSPGVRGAHARTPGPADEEGPDARPQAQAPPTDGDATVDTTGT
jgi:EAL domain-containing protein (putative c-di-GMP-specific phosphodiesterase class I)